MNRTIVPVSKNYLDGLQAYKFGLVFGFSILLIITLIEGDVIFLVLTISMLILVVLSFIFHVTAPPPMIISSNTVRIPKWLVKKRKWIYESVRTTDIVEIKRNHFRLKNGKKHYYRAFYKIKREELQELINGSKSSA